MAKNLDSAIESAHNKHYKKYFSTQVLSLVDESSIFIPSIHFPNSFAYKLRHNSKYWSTPKPNDLKFKHNIPDK